MTTGTKPTLREIRQLKRVLKKAARDLKRATTFAYRTTDVKDLNRVLDKACDGVCRVIEDLEAANG